MIVIIGDIERDDFMLFPSFIVFYKRQFVAIVFLVVIGFYNVFFTVDDGLFFYMFAFCHQEFDFLSWFQILCIP